MEKFAFLSLLNEALLGSLYLYLSKANSCLDRQEFTCFMKFRNSRNFSTYIIKPKKKHTCIKHVSKGLPCYTHLYEVIRAYIEDIQKFSYFSFVL